MCIRDSTIALYKKCAEYALSKGIIIADTKFEFGLDENGNIVIGDEMLTPDSSRFWPADGYEPGHGDVYKRQVYSIGSMLGHEGSEALADAALKGLRGELHDDKNGGWYAGLTKDNEIVPTKQCYAHAFVILAASSGVLAGREGAADLLKDALVLYDLRFWNEEEGRCV